MKSPAHSGSEAVWSVVRGIRFSAYMWVVEFCSALISTPIRVNRVVRVCCGCFLFVVFVMCRVSVRPSFVHLVQMEGTRSIIVRRPAGRLS